MVSGDEWVGDRYSGLLKKTGVWHSGLSSDHASSGSWRKESSSDDCAPKVRIKKPAESNGGIVFAIVVSIFLAYVAKLSPVAPGLITVLMAFVGWALTLVLVRRLVVWSFGLRETSKVDRFLLVLGALAVGVVVVEGWLHFADALNLGRLAGQEMPVEWQKRDILVPGSKSAHYWHEILFVFDENGMRRTEPFPPRRKNVCRVVIVGDSLTYGYGVRIEETYPSILAGTLSEQGSVEVLNLGVSGRASGEILGIVREFVPKLNPDIVVYGVCLNDFLPNGVGEYSTPQVSWIPVRLKVFLASRTKVGALVRDSYSDLLVALGIQNDFFDDILKDYGSYRSRFARDLKAMNDFVTSQGIPPVVSVVLDQYPEYGGRGYRISRFAEEAALEAGMTVVPTEEYYRQHDGERMSVSRWEGHPNSRAHKLFADLLLPYLRNHPGLTSCSSSEN